MAKTVTFLQLSPEFGSTRFGPFLHPETRLGSDPERNDITLPETLGVAAEHVKILKQTDGSYILAPVDRTASVFHFRAGSNRSRHVTTPVAVQGGDSFALVTPEGPRFTIVAEMDRAAIEAAARDSEGPGLTGIPKVNINSRGILMEIRRVGIARLTMTKAGHAFQNIWRLVATGQIFSPMYIVMGIGMLSGWLFAGGAACTALSFNSRKTDALDQLSNCRDQLGVTDEDSGDPTVPGLTKKILIDRTWTAAIENDKDLYQAYAKELQNVFTGPEKYEWVYTKSGSDFVRFKKALEGGGVPEDLVRVMAYAAALPGYGGDKEWTMVIDSEGDEVCGRGPLGLTYAQAHRLGLASLQLDALVERQVAASSDVEAQRAALERTAVRIDAPTAFDRDLVRTAGAQLQGGAECVYVEGEDDRLDPKKLADAVRDKLGATVAKDLPRESESYWIAARVVKLFSYDFKRPLPSELSFDAKTTPSTTMALQEVSDRRAAYAIRESAKVIARAVAIPCLAALDKETRRAPPTFLWELPNLGSCAIVKAFVEYDQL